MLPEDDRWSETRSQLLAQMDVSMGGRVAEEIIFGPEYITTGEEQTWWLVRHVMCVVMHWTLPCRWGQVNGLLKAHPTIFWCLPTNWFTLLSLLHACICYSCFQAKHWHMIIKTHFLSKLSLKADSVCSGASSDFDSATSIAKMMVTRFGMCEKVTPPLCCIAVWILACSMHYYYTMRKISSANRGF